MKRVGIRTQDTAGDWRPTDGYSLSERRTVGSLTITRLADGVAVAHIDNDTLFGRTRRPICEFVSDDGSHIFITVGGGRNPWLLHRVDLRPTPKIAASYELGPRAAMINITGSSPGVVAACSTEMFKPPKVRWFHVFDDSLNLLHRQQVNKPWRVSSIIDTPATLILLHGLDEAGTGHGSQFVAQTERGSRPRVLERAGPIPVETRSVTLSSPRTENGSLRVSGTRRPDWSSGPQSPVSWSGTSSSRAAGNRCLEMFP